MRYHLPALLAANFCFAHPTSESSYLATRDNGGSRNAHAGAFHDGPGYVDPILKGHSFIPPYQIKNPSRSQCPLLNMLANHGFLPRNGRNIDGSTFTNSIIESLNYEPQLADAITTSFFGKLGNPKSIDLEAINTNANDTDHDASFSRLDKIQWPQLSTAGTPYGSLLQNPWIIEALSTDAVPRGATFLNAAALARTRMRREAESIAAGSAPLSSALKLRAQRETALALQFVGEGGDPNIIGGGEDVWDQRKASLEAMKEWLLFERFPKGWRRTPHPVTDLGDITPLANRITYWVEHKP